MFIEKWQLMFLYIGRMDWGGGGGGRRAFDHHNRNGERGICQQKLRTGPSIFQFFFSGFARGGMLAAGIDSHIRSSFHSFIANLFILFYFHNQCL